METSTLSEQEHGIGFGIPIGSAELRARLAMVEDARGLVVVANGDGDRLYDETNNCVAEHLVESGFATLVVDLLTPNEAAEDAETAELRFNQSLLAARLLRVVRWISSRPDLEDVGVGFFASGLCAGAALAAASVYPDIRAVVCRGARFDSLVVPQLHRVKAEVLLLVGERDTAHLDASRGAFWLLPNGRLSVLPAAGHMLDEPRTLARIAEEAARWLGCAFGARI